MSDSVRFVHAADLHLDAPFAGVSADDQRIGGALADATYAAFERVIDTCIERSAQFLVIAGDAYNSAHTSLKAQLRFRAGMERLSAAGIEAFIVHGNHDPASGYSARLEMPDSVHVFPVDRVGRFEVEKDGVVVAALYGRSFSTSAELDNFALGYVREAADPLAIGVLHANVGGNTGYDPYAPASLEDLRAARMDYWALGHIHKQEFLARDPWIVYSGSPQGLNPKETGPHGCLVVEVSAGGVVSVEHVETAPVTWVQMECDASVAQSIDQLTVVLGEACDRLREAAGRPVVGRLTLAGRTEIHSDLARSGTLAALVDEVRREQAAREPWMWLDRVTDHTAAAIDMDAVREGGDFASELVRIADELAGDPAALATLMDEITGPLGSTLPGYQPSITSVETLESARDAALDLLLAKGGART